MNNLKVSYLITCYNETNTLKNLLLKLNEYLHLNDQIVILFDSLNGTKETSEIINSFYNSKRNIPDVIHINQIPFNKNYAAHKNQGNEICEGNFIFQCDGDEMPPESLLGNNLHSIIEANPTNELIWIPRINDFKGVTQEHANQWGWKLEPSPFLNGRPKAAWPDYQGRIYKNVPDRIKWKNRLHETITGHNQFAMLPADEDYALYHDKTIEGQIENNLRYNKEFTQAENRGISDKK